MSLSDSPSNDTRLENIEAGVSAIIQHNRETKADVLAVRQSIHGLEDRFTQLEKSVALLVNGHG